MEKFLLPLLLLFSKFILVNFFSLPWSFFDPLIACVIIYTFFHNLDTKAFILYALFCGLLREFFSLDVFGIYLLAYLGCSLSVAFLARLVDRHNWMLIFPVVFFGNVLANLVVFLLRPLLDSTVSVGPTGLFFARSLLEALGTTLIVYPLYLFSKKCGLKLTE